MTIGEAAKLIYSEVKDNYHRTGQDGAGRKALLEKHPEMGESIICDAIRQLDREGLVTVQYADNKPLLFILKH